MLLWGSQYSWLEYDTIGCKMFCTVCKKHKKNAFATSGLSNFRRSALIDHSKSSEHTDTICAVLKAKQAAPVFATLSEKADQSKEDLAILKFEELINFPERCQCPTYCESFIAIVMAATNSLLWRVHRI